MKYTSYVLLALGTLLMVSPLNLARASQAEKLQKATETLDLLSTEHQRLEERSSEIRRILGQPNLTEKDRSDLLTEQKAINVVLDNMSAELQKLMASQQGAEGPACPKKSPELEKLENYFKAMTQRDANQVAQLVAKSQGFEAVSDKFRKNAETQQGALQKIIGALGIWKNNCAKK